MGLGLRVGAGGLGGVLRGGDGVGMVGLVGVVKGRERGCLQDRGWLDRLGGVGAAFWTQCEAFDDAVLTLAYRCSVYYPLPSRHVFLSLQLGASQIDVYIGCLCHVIAARLGVVVIIISQSNSKPITE